LNRCFDDIEQFMARLHGVADAIKELEKRRRNRKKKGPVSGGLFLLVPNIYTIRHGLVVVMDAVVACMRADAEVDGSLLAFEMRSVLMWALLKTSVRPSVRLIVQWMMT
jgi:hypothetical protein